MDQQVGGGALHFFAVEPGDEGHDLAGADLVGGDHPGAKGAGAREVLAGGPLRGGGLPVAHAGVVVAGVASHVAPGHVFSDAAARLADDDGDLALEVERWRFGRNEQGLAVPGLRVGHAQEERGRLLWHGLSAGLAHVVGVVQAHADDLGRAADHGQELDGVERNALGGSAREGRSVFKQALRDHALQVGRERAQGGAQVHQVLVVDHGAVGGGALVQEAGEFQEGPLWSWFSSTGCRRRRWHVSNR